MTSESEISYLHANHVRVTTFLHLYEHILRLQVPVHNVLVMHVVDSEQNLLQNESDFLLGELLFFQNVAAQITSRHQLHDDVEFALIFEEFNHSDNVRMLSLLQNLKFLIH